MNYYSIKCTNCGAPLNIRGGGRINSVTCEYCMSVLDMNDNYAVLSKFSNVVRPDTPFKLGMQGNINGIDWVIIACVTYKTSYPEDDPWSEFSLYSPLYGYAWLVYEEGNKLSFSKRVRDFDLYTWEKKRRPKTSFYKKSHYLRAEKPYNAFISFVEGELSWIAKKGQKVKCWDYANSKSKSLTIEQTKDEIEVYHTDKLDTKKVYDSFGIDSSDLPLPPEPISTNTIISLGVLFLMIFLSFIVQSNVYNKPYTVKDAHSSFIISSGFMTKVSIDATSNSRLKDFSIRIRPQREDRPYFYIDINKSVFEGKNLGATWGTSADYTNVFLNMKEGTYTIDIKNGKLVTVNIEQRYIALDYIMMMLGLYIIFGIATMIYRINKNHHILYGFIAFIIGSYTIGIGMTIVILIGYVAYINYQKGKVK